MQLQDVQYRRLNSDPGDIIILLGGRTGRDGCGGATGSSKAHNSTVSLRPVVQKYRRVMLRQRRKIQRLFRREEVATIIKKCNDFGAGGVSVAIGELADWSGCRSGQGSEEICRSGWNRACYFRIPGAYGSRSSIRRM